MEILSDMKRPNDRTNINYFHSLVKKSPPLTELSNYVNDKILKPTKIVVNFQIIPFFKEFLKKISFIPQEIFQFKEISRRKFVDLLIIKLTKHLFLFF